MLFDYRPQGCHQLIDIEKRGPLFCFKCKLVPKAANTPLLYQLWETDNSAFSRICNSRVDQLFTEKRPKSKNVLKIVLSGMDKFSRKRDSIMQNCPTLLPSFAKASKAEHTFPISTNGDKCKLCFEFFETPFLQWKVLFLLVICCDLWHNSCFLLKGHLFH